MNNASSTSQAEQIL